MFLSFHNNFLTRVNHTFSDYSSSYATLFEEAFVGKKLTLARELLKNDLSLIRLCHQGKNYLERAVETEALDFVELYLETLLPHPEFKQFLEGVDFHRCFEAAFNLGRPSLAALLLKIDSLFGEDQQFDLKLSHYLERALVREDMDFVELLLAVINQKLDFCFQGEDLAAICEKAFNHRRWSLFRLILKNQPQLLNWLNEERSNFVQRAIQSSSMECLEICLDTMLNFRTSLFCPPADLSIIFELAFQFGNISLIEKLLKFNPRLCLYNDKFGKNYLVRAIESFHLNFVECFLQYISWLNADNYLPPTIDLTSIFVTAYQTRRLPLLRQLLIVQPTLLASTQYQEKTFVQRALEEGEFECLEIFFGFVSSRRDFYRLALALDFRNAFEYAFSKGKKGFMCLLLKFQPQLLACPNPFGKNYLARAVAALDYASLEIFLPIVRLHSDFHNLLTTIDLRRVFESAFVLQNTLLIDLLLFFRPSLIQERDSQYTPYLHLASRWGNTLLVKLSLQAGVNPLEVFGHERLTPLHNACEKGSLEIVQIIVKWDHDTLDAVNDKGYSPLHYACFFGHVEVADYLLSCGADPLHNFPACGKNALHLACIEGKEDVAALLLKRLPSLATIPTSNDFHPLFLACGAGMCEVARQLLDLGVLIDQPNGPHGCTALYNAANFNQPRIVEELLYRGASILVATKHPEGIGDIECTEEVAQVFADWQQERRGNIDTQYLEDENAWTLKVLQWLHQEYFLSQIYTFLSEEALAVVKQELSTTLFDQSFDEKLGKIINSFFDLLEIYAIEDEFNQIAQEIRAIGVHVNFLQRLVGGSLIDESDRELLFEPYSKVVQSYHCLLGFLSITHKTIASA